MGLCETCDSGLRTKIVRVDGELLYVCDSCFGEFDGHVFVCELVNGKAVMGPYQSLPGYDPATKMFNGARVDSVKKVRVKVCDMPTVRHEKVVM